jgi:hypothetical protein
VVQQLPALQQQLRPDELSAAAEFALTEGMRQPIMQVRGQAQFIHLLTHLLTYAASTFKQCHHCCPSEQV